MAGVPRLEGLSSSSANSIAIVVAQFEFGTDVKEVRATIEQNLQTAGLPPSVSPQVAALNINASPVIIASVAGVPQEGVSADEQLDAAAQVARDEIVPALLGIDGVATVDLTGGLETQAVVTLDPAKLTETGISRRAGHGHPRGQQPDGPDGPDLDRRDEHPGLDDRVDHVARPDREPRRRREDAGDRAHASPARPRPGPGRPPAPPRPSPSRPRRSSSRTSPPSRRQASRRPATPARTACRR